MWLIYQLQLVAVVLNHLITVHLVVKDQIQYFLLLHQLVEDLVVLKITLQQLVVTEDQAVAVVQILVKLVLVAQVIHHL